VFVVELDREPAELLERFGVVGLLPGLLELLPERDRQPIKRRLTQINLGAHSPRACARDAPSRAEDDEDQDAARDAYQQAAQIARPE